MPGTAAPLLPGLGTCQASQLQLHVTSSQGSATESVLADRYCTCVLCIPDAVLSTWSAGTAVPPASAERAKRPTSHSPAPHSAV